jgi:S-adenosylhomocysteine hydrolase
MEIDTVIGIPYSSNNVDQHNPSSSRNDNLKNRFESQLQGDNDGNNITATTSVHVPACMEEFAKTVESSIDQALARCQDKNQRLIVQDCGGTAVELLHSETSNYDLVRRMEHVEGVVEITKRGLWKAQELQDVLQIPVLHSADSELKRMEAVRCGETVALCLDKVARTDLGWSLAGRKVAVFGMGWIGSNVARGLRNLGAIVHQVYDTDPIKIMDAQLNGFPASNANDIGSADGNSTANVALKECDVVVGASGRQSLTRAVLEQLRDGVLVASASSKQVEFDMDYMQHECSVFPVSDVINGYRTRTGSTILLSNNGFPINFVPGSTSVPDEIVETILGELLLQMHQLASSRINDSSVLSPGIYRISEEQERQVANMWLSLRNDTSGTAQGAITTTDRTAASNVEQYLYIHDEPPPKYNYIQERGLQTSSHTQESATADIADVRNGDGIQDNSPYLVQRLLGQKPNLYGTAKFSVVGGYIRPIAANLDRPVRILDLGCSTSISKEYLSTTLGKSVDFEYCGVDYEAAFEPDIVMDITEIERRRSELPWTPDVILMLDVLEHLPGKERDIEKVVSESAKLLPPHGLILAVVPQLYRLDRLKLQHLHYPEHQVRFTLDEWASIIKQGAGISEIRGIGYISCIPYLPMLSPWYRDDNGHGSLFRYLRGTAFEWEPLKPVEVFLTSLLGSTLQGWCNSSLLVLEPEQELEGEKPA